MTPTSCSTPLGTIPRGTLGTRQRERRSLCRHGTCPQGERWFLPARDGPSQYTSEVWSPGFSRCGSPATGRRGISRWVEREGFRRLKPGLRTLRTLSGIGCRSCAMSLGRGGSRVNTDCASAAGRTTDHGPRTGAGGAGSFNSPPTERRPPRRCRRRSCGRRGGRWRPRGQSSISHRGSGSGQAARTSPDWPSPG